ncbi:MAG: ATP-binding protein [Gammaproteobacteria bacterium]|nr:ATP-binding protein [Gammaproteobacteria bacterium]
MINRSLKLEKHVENNKVLIIYGPRQVGKTTLVAEYLKNYREEYILKTGDDIPFSSELSQCSLDWLQKKIPDGVLLIIDEAQKIPNIGRALKLIVDHIKDVKVIVTGSSSFDLLNSTGESLTGRKHVVMLYPISISESLSITNKYDLDNNIKNYLVYGMYPAVFSSELHTKKVEIINEITNSYLLKDILAFDKVKNSRKIIDLLKLIAYQIGQEVSTTELAQNLGIDKNTVLRYLDLLEKSFVLFSLGGFSRNLRKEVCKMNKYYFYDLGIRNSLIANFNSLDTRIDVGQLWENFIIIERMKRNSYTNVVVNYYYWRTYDRKEMDLIEEKGGHLYGYEFKWKKDKTKVPQEWLDTYKNSHFGIINQSNYFDFVVYE